jgi:hypothetical protein
MFFSEIEKLRVEINALKLSKDELKKEDLSSDKEVEKVELEKEEVSGISHNPENKSDKRELNLYSQKGKQTTLSRILNKLNK